MTNGGGTEIVATEVVPDGEKMMGETDVNAICLMIGEGLEGVAVIEPYSRADRADLVDQAGRENGAQAHRRRRKSPRQISPMSWAYLIGDDV